MIREYIFCSVIESPQMARRSPFSSSSRFVCGALISLNFAKEGSFGVGSGATAETNAPEKIPTKITKQN
jgi:hypothetical protein